MIDEVKNYHYKNKTIPEYQLKKFIKLKKYDYLYKNVKSNNQIKTIVNFSNEKEDKYSYYMDLLKLFVKLLGIKNLPNIINIINKYDNDSDIYKELKKINNKCSLYNTKPSEKIENISFYLLPFLKNINGCFLDFGCGNCKYTRFYGKSLGFSKKNIYGTDIEKWFNYDKFTRKELGNNFKVIKNNLPFENNKFQVVISLMVLHHIENLDETLKELKRVIKPNGFLFLSEQVPAGFGERIIIDIEHAIYELIIGNNNFDNFAKDYYSNYYHWLEWQLILEKYNFKLLKKEYLKENDINQNTITRKIIMIYQLN